MSYLSSIERYHEYREAIRELLDSILIGMSQENLLENEQALHQALCQVSSCYPFVDLLYTLDEHGVQTSENVVCQTGWQSNRVTGKGKDRSRRPYYQMAKSSDRVEITEPYLSSASRQLCISAALRWQRAEGNSTGFIVVDIDLGRIVEFLMGDATRKRFLPAFRAVYSLIVLGLFTVVGVLLFSAFHEIYLLLIQESASSNHRLKPFEVIIFLTLGLAVFDLGKTILEEEVLMHKDIFRHSSTRRTITRFSAAIIIAVLIEALLMMFKSALGESESMMSSVWMMFSAVGLLTGLGLYVYLGALAEAKLLSLRRARQ